MSIPNELVQGIVDIKTAIENKSADTPVDIPDRDYPDELCEALGAVKDAIDNSQGGGGGGETVEIFTPILKMYNHSGSSKQTSAIIGVEVNGEIKIGCRAYQQTNNNFTYVRDAALIDGKLYAGLNSPQVKWSAQANCTVEQFTASDQYLAPIVQITPIDPTLDVEIELLTV